jgi:hypothetical protein
VRKVPQTALFIMLFSCSLFRLPAQTTQTTPSTQSVDLGLPATQFDMEGFPQWSKDLRRAEIVAFGSFPFTMFIASTAMETWRFSAHGGDQRYAPWPFKGAQAIDMSAEEHKKVILYAVLGSVALSLTDFVIVQIKRSNERKRAESLPAGTPIVVRSPMGDGEGDAGAGEGGIAADTADAGDGSDAADTASSDGDGEAGVP